MANYNVLSLNGSSAIIYDIENNYVFKLFNPEYRDLTNNENFSMYNMLINLSNLENVSGYVKPEIIITGNNYLFGYIMKKINGPSLENLPLDTEILYLIIGLEELKETVMKISSQHMILYDLNLGNIVCDEKMHLIDLDLSYVDNNKSEKEIYFCNIINLFEIIRSVLADYNEQIFDNSVLSYYEDLYNRFLSDDFISYFDHLIYIVESKINKNIVTIKDFKEALHLLKKKQGLYRGV